MRLRNRLVIANWKMHGSRDLCNEFASCLRPPENIDVWLAPSALHVGSFVANEMDSVSIGLQNVHAEQSGAYTGEMSAAMARDLGATFAIVGHSERRTLFQETDDVVAKKFRACLDADIVPVLCVGESLEQREEGIAKDVVWNQVEIVLKECGATNLREAEIAYEPVWAIGTGVVASPEDAEDMHEYLRSMICDTTALSGEEFRILYGGSVKVENAGSLIAQSNIDGFLVGGASLDVESLNRICQIASGV